MRLNNRQIDFINHEDRALDRLIKSKPATGIYRAVARQEALKLIKDIYRLKDD